MNTYPQEVNLTLLGNPIGIARYSVFVQESAENPIRYRGWVLYREGSQDKPRSLGLGLEWKPTSPDEVINAITKAGYTPATHYIDNGRLHWGAIFYDPTTAEADPISDQIHPKGNYLYRGILVTGSLKKGRAIHIRGGFFRHVCTNGLVSGIFSHHKIIGTSRVTEGVVRSALREIDDRFRNISFILHSTFDYTGIREKVLGIQKWSQKLDEILRSYLLFTGKDSITLIDLLNWITSAAPEETMYLDRYVRTALLKFQIKLPDDLSEQEVIQRFKALRLAELENENEQLRGS